ncbi:hypothetical protein SDC9_73114 [bioreactor metagenome]|uniref:Uncharacterized protein n=1 Tax=bioreactor metagenome TaxID=1076179 RepID=A0A644YDN5_9ZZZZ
MEHWYHRQRGGLQFARHDASYRLGGRHGRHGTDVIDIENGLAYRTLVGLSALGATGRARGEEDQRRGIRGQRRCIESIMSRSNQIAPGHITALAIHDHNLGRRFQVWQAGRHALPTIRIADQPTRRGVFQIRHQLAHQPKAVERHRHRANQGHRRKRHGPFGAVAHGNRHALASAQAVQSLQAAGKRIGCGKESVERPAVFTIDQELQRPMRSTCVDHIGQGAKGVAICVEATAIL